MGCYFRHEKRNVLIYINTVQKWWPSMWKWVCKKMDHPVFGEKFSLLSISDSMYLSCIIVLIGYELISLQLRKTHANRQSSSKLRKHHHQFDNARTHVCTHARTHARTHTLLVKTLCDVFPVFRGCFGGAVFMSAWWHPPEAPDVSAASWTNKLLSCKTLKHSRQLWTLYNIWDCIGFG